MVLFVAVYCCSVKLVWCGIIMFVFSNNLLLWYLGKLVKLLMLVKVMFDYLNGLSNE